MKLSFVLWAFIIGVAIGTVYTFYTKMVLGGLVRKLIAIDACSLETAIPLDRINYKMSSSVKRSLRKGTSFSQTVLFDENGNYYINPTDLKKAKIKYKNEGTTVFLLLMILFILAGVALISTYIFPEVIDKFNVFIKGFTE